jgi:HEAT repeat protein
MDMTNSQLKPAAFAALATTALTLSAAEHKAVDELISKIKSQDDSVRGPAWQNAGPAGAPAVKPLAQVMTDQDMEVSRSAKRALWNIVRHAGRPGAEKEKRAVAAELVALLNGGHQSVRREALWMLSEIGADDAIKPIAACLSVAELREDARAALERIPGPKAIAALKEGLNSAPEEFKPAIAQSLRVRGVNVTGYPSQKLVPTRPAPANPPQTI